ncbi:MAG: hydantoinase B/oxoprolinase family protein [Armatimonadota bacterium]|nr:hydantoinase B/oxoprolinase family protein [Armatimonadota bacterium]
MRQPRVGREDRDPFTIAIVGEALRTISEEMFAVQGRVSQSPVIYEVLDYACGLTDPVGSLVAQGQGVTGFLGTLSAAVQETLSKFGRKLSPGDVIGTNDPYGGGGTHPSDVTLVAPLFYEGELVAFAASKAHWTELGGKHPGSWTTDAVDVYQEGLLIPCIKLLGSGRPAQGLLEWIAANVRLPEMTLGDLWAGVAALRIADRRVGELCRRFGKATVRAAMAHLLDHSECLARRELRKLAPGCYRAQDWVDDDGVGNGPFPVCVEVTVTPERFVCDFTGTHPQVPGPINSTWATLLSSVRQAFLGVVGPQLPVNDGCFRAVEAICPPGTLFTARKPAPVSAYWETDGLATDLVWKALAPALPDRLPAGHFLSVCATIISGLHPDTGELFLLVEPQPGGWGAGCGKDGESGLVCSGDGETYVVPAEVCEARYGVRVEEFGFAIEDGGAGQFRGGRGVVREYRVVGPEAFLTVAFGRHRFVPWGVAGGRDGSPNYVEVFHTDGRRVRFGKCTRYRLGRDDRVRLVTGTGGGWGDPSSRDPARIYEDLRNGIVTVEQSRRDYPHAMREVTLEPRGKPRLPGRKNAARRGATRRFHSG